MNLCPITYLPTDKKYSYNGLKLLSRDIVQLKDLPLTQEEQLREIAIRAGVMSIPGVQSKLSAKFNVQDETFEVVDLGGEYILKPQNRFYPGQPENESLTMKLAELVEIEVPLNGLIYCVDGTFTYFIKRFDRYGNGNKLSVEDFAQLAGKSRETKYNYSMEKLSALIVKHCTFPVIEKVKLFRLAVFNFLIGNEDMHLKNFSLITKDNITGLSPAYDLLNITITLKNSAEEFALPLAGKKRNINLKLLVEYFGKERLKLNDMIISQVLNKFSDSLDRWNELLAVSFLSDEMKEKYFNLLRIRKTKLGL